MQVRARWDDAVGPWQQLVLRRAQHGACPSELAPISAPISGMGGGDANAKPLCYGDALSLTIAHLGKYVSTQVRGGRVVADRLRQGEYGAREPVAHELFVLESAVLGARDGAVVHVGDAVRLRAAGVRAVSGAPLYLLSAEDRGMLRDCNLAEDGGGEGGGGEGGGGDGGGPERVSLGVLSEGAPEHLGAWTLHAGAAQLPPMRIGLEVPLVRGLPFGCPLIALMDLD